MPVGKNISGAAWYLLNLLILTLSGAALISAYPSLVYYEVAEVADFLTPAILVLILAVGIGYHFQRARHCFAPRTGTGAAPRLRTRIFFRLFEAGVIVCAFAAFGEAFVFGELTCGYPGRAGSESLGGFLAAENIHFKANGMYAGNFTDLNNTLNARPPYLQGKSRHGYIFSLSVNGDGKHFEAIATPHKPPEDHWPSFYVDDSGVVRVSVDGSRPTKDSQKLSEDRR